MSLSTIRIVMLLPAFLLCLAGCTISYGIRPELLPSGDAKALVQQYPLSVGLHIAPKVRTKEYRQGLALVPAGDQLTISFTWAVGQLFANTVMLDHMPAGNQLPDGLSGAIELADVDLHDGNATTKYAINFYSATGELLETWSASGGFALWDIELSSVSASMQNVGTGLSYSIRDTTANFMVELPKQRAIRNWLEAAKLQYGELAPPQASSSVGHARHDKVLLLPDTYSWRYTDNGEAMQCVGNRLRSYQPPIAVSVMTDVVRLQFFPWLEPSTGPRLAEDFIAWLALPAVRNKFDELGFRFLLSHQGGTRTTIPGGGILCGASMGGGGCLGFAWGTHESSFTATLFDMHTQASPRDFASLKSSGVYVPAFVLPIPLLAPTESAACESLARDVYDALNRLRQAE
ncbi:MAG: hypothetical protein FIB06_04840 [Betaproteobacteria bacterium]|nr:hypothetical protein [Betaproteobacteria bacterium]